ncbi:MAG: vanadium-dependent haloperoxidase, partial [Candidatus Polarisedimenticolia bacterium]
GVALALAAEASAPGRSAEHRPTRGMEMLRHWNEIAIDSSGLDHTPVTPGEDRVFGEQMGPGRASRAIAIVQVAVFEAVNAVAGGYRSEHGIPRASRDTSVEAAMAQAAHDTLVVLFPSQEEACDAHLAEDLGKLMHGVPRSKGIELGRRAAAAVLAARAHDGSEIPEARLGIDYFPGPDPGVWRQDPISLLPLALGARWGEVRPFVLQSADQFRVPPPPALSSPEYAAAYNEVKRLGGDGIVTPTERTPDQTIAGLYWAYDGTPSLCAPPRLYNQIVMQIAEAMGTDVAGTARLLALANMAMADAGIAIWESKYHYKFWRPVTGIRESDPGTGPTGAGDGNPDTAGDPTYTPLGAPASNAVTVNFTPPFPAYPSGHAGFGGALFQTLRNFYGTDDIPFTFVSDEFNGVTRDNGGNVRPLIPRTFASLSQAEEENGQSRIYLGIHWSFDKTEAIAQGRRIADYVFQNAFVPERGTRPGR